MHLIICTYPPRLRICVPGTEQNLKSGQIDTARLVWLQPQLHALEASAIDILFRVWKNRGAAWQSHLLLNGQNRIRMWVVSPRSGWWQFRWRKLTVAQVCEAGGVCKRRHAGIPPHDYSTSHQLLPTVIYFSCRPSVLQSWLKELVGATPWATRLSRKAGRQAGRTFNQTREGC